MSEVTFHLPWPPKALSPNSRINAFARAAAAKTYKKKCYFISLAHIRKEKFVRHEHPLYPEGRVYVRIAFYPPHHYRYDEDNMVASFKAGLDGLRDAMGIDDHWFHIMSDVGDELVKNGLVRVTLEVDDAG